MNIIEGDILKVLILEPYVNQRILAEAIGHSLGAINRSLKGFIEEGYLDYAYRITEKARRAIKENLPQNAIILPAGFGMRMVPINTEMPKGLLRVHGEILIERIIKQLQTTGIKKYIVVGFLKEQYEYLIEKFGVDLIVNPEYAAQNNLYSLWKVLEQLSNSYIVPCDIWCRKNPFSSNELYSWYMVSDSITNTSFPQNWPIFHWAYWMVWCAAAPFFIGSISRGRTVRQTILGGYVFGVGSTLVSFIILGNYSLGKQMSGQADFLALYEKTGNPYEVVIAIIRTLPCAPIILLILLITMISFYATSFDSIALIGACYSYYRLGENKTTHKFVKLLWCILLILLPIALTFSESSMNNLQSVSIIAAFPIGGVIVLIAISFLKDASKFLREQKNGNQER